MAPMDRNQDEEMLEDPNFDIFENSSPQRPLDIYGGALANDSVDTLVHVNGDINYSRKREFAPPSPTRGGFGNDEQHSSKRQRSDHWPLSPTEDDAHQMYTASSRSRRHVSTPSRPSRFQEGSMHDRPSDKPPSVFTRHFNAHLNASVDHLMEDYHESNKPLRDHPATSKPLPRRPLSKSPQRQIQPNRMTHHSNVSAWSETTAATNENEPTEGPTGKHSGIFRFGKSVASAFNPVSIWQKVTTSWRDAKEELIQEAQDERTKEFIERQARAEQAYAELKQAGKLGAQGSRVISEDAKVFSPGYTSPENEPNPRDSGIVMDDESRSSMDTSKGSFLQPVESSRKGSWHGRTPSFNNLKKIASEINLHKRTISGSSMSPEKDSALRRTQSRNDLKKQQKLCKRVSDLESKLQSARRELSSALGDPAPVISRSSTPTHPLPSLPRPDGRQHGSWRRTYAPALPSLPSERLLNPGGLLLEDDAGPAQHLDSDVDTLAAIEAQAEGSSIRETLAESPVRGEVDNGFYMQPNQPLTTQTNFEFSSPIKMEPRSEASDMVDIIEPPPKTPADVTSFLADPSSPRTESPKKTSPKKAIVKKKLAKNDRSYRPGVESADDDAEWEAAKPKTLKKKRSTDVTNSPKSQKNKASRVSLAAETPAKKANVLTKPPPPVKTPAIVIEEIAPPRGSLETVHEEVFTTTTVAINDVPSKPTAQATPAHPGRHRITRSRSPSKTPRKTLGVGITPYKVREARSMSPPPSSTNGKMQREDELVITAKPNGRDVPPMPGSEAIEGGDLKKKGSFEWPEDCF